MCAALFGLASRYVLGASGICYCSTRQGEAPPTRPAGWTEGHPRTPAAQQACGSGHVHAQMVQCHARKLLGLYADALNHGVIVAVGTLW